MEVYPIRFQPVYRNYIWGGRRIREKYHRDVHEKRVAESWEIVDRQDDQSVVINGSYQNKTLHELIVRWQERLLGRKTTFSRFPLLIKLIDAEENLSVQVHPDDQSASVMQAEAKNEVWYMLEVKKSAAVYAGLKPEVDEKVFKDALQRDRVVELLKKIPVQKEDVIFVPGGRVHAICAGCMLLEVQQNSDTTYRIYDWNRVDDTKKPRALHIKEALRVIHFDDEDDPHIKPRLAYAKEKTNVWDLIKTPFFHLQRLDIHHTLALKPNHQSFQIFFLIQGVATLIADEKKENMCLGSSWLVPACAKKVSLTTQSFCRVIKISLP